MLHKLEIVHLRAVVIQVNLSPNLSSTRHKPLAALFSNVMRDLLRLIGFGPGQSLHLLFFFSVCLGCASFSVLPHLRLLLLVLGSSTFSESWITKCFCPAFQHPPLLLLACLLHVGVDVYLFVQQYHQNIDRLIHT